MNLHSPTIRSSLPGMTWPALPDASGAQVLALLFQLEQTQWWSSDCLRAEQHRQLEEVLAHASRTVPYYRDAPRAGPDGACRPLEGWPVLKRDAVQAAGERLFSREIPAAHGGTAVIETSGATGRPVRIQATEYTGLMWKAFTLRDHFWHRRDLGGKLAAIRVISDPRARPPDGFVGTGWGAATDGLYVTGPVAALSIRATVSEQVCWLQRHDPAYLLSYPSNLMALARHCTERKINLPGLREVRTVSEIVTDELRAACRDAWDVPVVDTYSTQENGYLALQCPETGAYHVQAENVLVEVLDEAGRACTPGQIGRVIVTGLHNFASPLIRYEVGDYAEVGGPCPCGRGLPVLARIVGRQRNMLVLPTGEKIWPLVGFLSEAPVRQYQVIQKSTDRLEVRLVPRHRFSRADEQRVRELLNDRAFRYPFKIDFVYLDEIPRGPSGKFEEFVSEIAG